jgi:DNA-binding NtrC family response regulator
MDAATILVVDDEPLVRWSVSETLQESGCRVIEAGDAATALRAMAAPTLSADAVLLDLDLPDSRDLGLLSAIHTLAPAIPIILMTAHGSNEIFEEARRRGAFASLHKPFELGDLSPLIDQALAGRVH